MVRTFRHCKLVEIAMHLSTLCFNYFVYMPGIVSCVNMYACVSVCMYVCMHGRMDRWMDGCMEGWMDGWVGGWVDGWMGGWMDRRMHVCMFRPK